MWDKTIDEIKQEVVEVFEPHLKGKLCEQEIGLLYDMFEKYKGLRKCGKDTK